MNVIELHKPVWDGLQARRAKLPHALLLLGQRGLGKYDLARQFAGGLLCESPQADGVACGKCLACNWYKQGHHPDFRLLVPEAMAEGEDDAKEAKDSKEGKEKKASQQITIDQVRELDDFFNVGTHRSGLRIIIIYPAEAMNRNCANAILKSLEEPAPGTLFLLVSNEPLRLLPTIRSRCQAVPVSLPTAARSLAALSADGVTDGEQWLALAGGSPKLARELATGPAGKDIPLIVKCLSQGANGDALAAAAELDKVLKDSKGKQSLRQIVEWMQRWVVDLNLAKQDLPVRYFLRQRATMQALVAEVPSLRLVRFHRRLVQARREVEQPVNTRLYLETLFLDYRVLLSPEPS